MLLFPGCNLFFFWLKNFKKQLTATTCQSLKVIPTHKFILSQTLNMAKSLCTPHV